MAMADIDERPLPSGTVTFLFTDVEGSTKLWARDSEAMSAALQLHDSILRRSASAHGGYVFATGGDSFAVAFDRVSSAVAMSLDVQDGLAEPPWPEGFELRVRIGIHVGEAEERNGDYFGPPVNSAARVSDAGHGGQTLITAEALQMMGGEASVRCLDLGVHELRDVASPVHLFQLGLDSFPRLRTPSVGIMSIPSPLTSLIGRETEVVDIRRLLVVHRLVTLTGVGGCGKTRLAIEVAQQEAPSRPQGVWFVDLSTIADENAVPGAFAAALSLTTDGASSVLDHIVTYLSIRDALLVVDNCEHLLDEVADLFDTILGRTETLRILATSREVLEIDGERSWRVPSLPNGAGSAAVQLFIERASLHAADFDPDPAATEVIAEICTRLDGIPLAIELAAARTRTMGVSELLDNLDDRFRLLSGGRRRSRQRQQTLDAAVRWSYDLLSTQEQSMLQHLSVFQGGFDLNDVAVVADVAPAVAFDLVDALLAKSLVSTTRSRGDSVRHHLLETVRLFALQELIIEGRSEVARNRHLDHFCDDPYVHDWGAWSTSSGQIRIETEIENLRAALNWAFECERPDAAVVIVCAVYDALTARGEINEVIAWLERIEQPRGELEVKRLAVLAHLHLQRFDLIAASELSSRAIEIAGHEPYDLVPFAGFIEGRSRLMKGEPVNLAAVADRMHHIASRTPSATTNVALTRLIDLAVISYDDTTEERRAQRLNDLVDQVTADAPDFHALDLFELSRDAHVLILAADEADADTTATRVRPDRQYATPWSYLHVILSIVASSSTIGVEAAGAALAEQAREIVARRPGIVGDWLIWFAYLRARLGDLDAAAQLLDRSTPINSNASLGFLRTRYSLPPRLQPDDLATRTERLAQQSDVLSNEIAHWE